MHLKIANNMANSVDHDETAQGVETVCPALSVLIFSITVEL